MRDPSSRVYMGVDLQEGSPESPGRARYYIVLVDEEGRVIGKYPGSPLSRLIRLALEYRPSSIGVDNVYELGSSEREIIRLLALLPDETQVVQVNVLDNVVSLREAARRAGLPVEAGKLSPGRTAYLAALLASRGMGTPVKSMEEKTLIVVSKARSGSKGGWSQQRFQRALRAVIHYAAMEIKEALDRAGLHYDYRYRKSVGGFESAVFIVYAKSDKVRAVISEGESLGCRIRIKPVYKVRIGVPLQSARRSSRSIIVGIDPGATTGIAVLDTRGNILYLNSTRSVDLGEILETVTSYGKPIIVAVDVRNPPEVVKRIASKMGAEVYVPSSDLSIQEKRNIAYSLVERQGIDVDLDSHKRDALAAAYKAYSSLKAKLGQVESEVRKLGLPLDVEKIKAEVLRGSTIAESIEREIERVLYRRKGRDEPVAPGSQAAGPGTGGGREGRNEQLLAVIEGLEAEKRVLESRVRDLERRLEEAEIRVREHLRNVRVEVAKEEAVIRLRQRIKSLEDETARLREALESQREAVKSLTAILACIARGECVPLRSVKVLTASSLKRTEKLLGPLRKGEVIHVADPNVFESKALDELRDKGVHGIIVEEGEAPFRKLAESRLMPVVTCTGLVVSRLDDMVVVNSSVLDKVASERRSLEARRAMTINLEKLVNEYRESRRAVKR
jgi:predicted RNase H-like nuclease (RuvC/YqgF family)